MTPIDAGNNDDDDDNNTSTTAINTASCRPLNKLEPCVAMCFQSFSFRTQQISTSDGHVRRLLRLTKKQPWWWWWPLIDAKCQSSWSQVQRVL